MTPRAKVQDGSAEGNPQGPASQQEGSPCFQFLATGAVGVPKGTGPTHVHSTEQFPNLAGKEVLQKPGEPTLDRTDGASAAGGLLDRPRKGSLFPALEGTGRAADCLCLCLTGIVPLSLLHSGRRTQPQIKSKASQQEGEVAVAQQGASLPALRPHGGNQTVNLGSLFYSGARDEPSS